MFIRVKQLFENTTIRVNLLAVISNERVNGVKIELRKLILYEANEKEGITEEQINGNVIPAMPRNHATPRLQFTTHYRYY